MPVSGFGWLFSLKTPEVLFSHLDRCVVKLDAAERREITDNSRSRPRMRYNVRAARSVERGAWHPGHNNYRLP